MPNEDKVFIKNQSYERYAENYVEKTEEKAWITLYERPNMHILIDKHINDIENKTVLDCGCATGYYSAYFSFKGAEVISVDSSSEMAKITQRRAEKAKVYQADLNYPLDFIKSNSIDIIK